MKKSILGIVALLPLCAVGEIVPSGVTSVGGRGLLRLPSARTLSKGTLCIHLNGTYRLESHDTTHAATDVTDRRHWGAGRIGFTYGVYDVFEFHLTSRFFGKYYEAVDEPQDWEDYRAIGFKDLTFGVKLGYPFYEKEMVGVGWLGGLHLFLNSPTLTSRPEKDSLLVELGFEPFLKKKTEIGAELLSDIELESISFHTGVGYLKAGELYEESETLLDTLNTKDLYTPKNRILWGVGSSVTIGKWVDLFAEVTGRKILDKPASLPDTVYLSPGIRLKSPLGTILEISGDYALVDDIPSWRVGVGLSSTTSLIPPPPKPPVLATVTGTVTDEETSEPLIAEISFPEDSGVTSTISTQTGVYEKPLSPGRYVIQAEKEGYRWKKSVIILKEGEQKVLDFVLSKKVVEKKGQLTGRIYDVKTDDPLIAQIKFPDTKVPSAASDQTGIYKVELGPGTYTVSVEADGYTSLAEPVVIGAEETIVKNFALKARPKKGERIVLRGIHFEFGKATIRPDSYGILDEAAKVLKDNPNLKVEIGGHTDSVGSDSYNMKLSFERANSVRRYLISVHGIDPIRLIAKGYGEGMPIADNKTKDGRAMNRRIEFFIIGD